jgi:hypothetical protein
MKGNIIWESRLTEEMVSHLNDNEISLLVNELDETVAAIAESYEVE